MERTPDPRVTWSVPYVVQYRSLSSKSWFTVKQLQGQLNIVRSKALEISFRTVSARLENKIRSKHHIEKKKYRPFFERVRSVCTSVCMCACVPVCVYARVRVLWSVRVSNAGVVFVRLQARCLLN